MWNGIFDLGIAAASIGGVVGAVWATQKRQEHGWSMLIMELFMAAVAAAGVADRWLDHQTNVFFCAATGMVVGICSGFVLDAAGELMPSLSREALTGIVDKFFKTRNDDPPKE